MRFDEIRREVRLRDRCRKAAMKQAAQLGVPLSAEQANIAYDAMVDLIRIEVREDE